MDNDCRCQCPECKDGSCCLGIYCDNRSLENDTPGEYVYQLMNVPNSKEDCGMCDIDEPHYHIGDSGPLCAGSHPHKSWCKATHYGIWTEVDV